VTAADVIFSFERMLAADAVTAGPLSGILAGAKEFQEGKAETVSGIRTVSPTTLEFSLTRPDSLFPGRISAPAYAIVNKAAVEAAGTEFGQTSHCSTGPYRFVERRGNELVLARFDGYWGGFGENSPEQVVIRTIKEDTLALAELRSNRVSIAYASPPMLKGIVERKDGKIALTESAAVAFRAQTNPVFNTYFLAFNQPSVHPDLRRAIFHAIDRNEVIAASVPASGFPAAGPIPLACAGYKPEVGPDRDLDKARAALDAFKTANPGSAPKLTILVHELSEAITTGEVIQSQLGKLGIEVELVQRNFNAVVGEIQKGSFEATVMGFEYQYSEPQLILENFYTSAAIPLPNLFHYKNPATDSAIAELLQQPHYKERLQAVAGVEKQIVEAVPGVFLYQTAQTLLIDPALSGVLANGANYLDLTRATRK
jgi:ABC-type transport system substrate-binding protein